MGPLRGRPAWDEVASPTDMATYSSRSTGSDKYKGTFKTGTGQESGNVDTMATYTSEQSTQPVGNGNVKRTGYETPPADITRIEGGRGPGGY